ncbi:MAG: cytochrome bc1 complex diheme cytochrome c subunit [Acidothermaceae bacterium]
MSSLAAPVGRPAGRRRRRLAGYAVLLAALIGVGSVYGFATSRGSAAAGNPSQQVLAGKSLFLQGCSSCHGLAAEGGTDAPSLIGVGAAAVDFQVSTGRMPLRQEGAQAERKPPRYTSDQIAQLAAFVASLGPGPAVPGKDQYTPSGADMGLGGNLFRTNCSSCHNFVGAGGALADGKHAPSLANATDKQIYEALLTGPGTMPAFSDKQLTEPEKQDIIAYVQGLKATPDPGGANLGRSGAVAEGLVAFLAGIVALGGVAMWIGARAKRAS